MPALTSKLWCQNKHIFEVHFLQTFRRSCGYARHAFLKSIHSSLVLYWFTIIGYRELSDFTVSSLSCLTVVHHNYKLLIHWYSNNSWIILLFLDDWKESIVPRQGASKTFLLEMLSNMHWIISSLPFSSFQRIHKVKITGE